MSGEWRYGTGHDRGGQVQAIKLNFAHMPIGHTEVQHERGT